MGFFVPNLSRNKAMAAGAAGGGVAAYCLMSLVPMVGDTYGRLLAAAILGAFIGLMVALLSPRAILQQSRRNALHGALSPKVAP